MTHRNQASQSELFLVNVYCKSLTKLKKLNATKLDLKRRTAKQTDFSEFVVTGILSTKDLEFLEKKSYDDIKILQDLSLITTHRLKEVSIENRFLNLELMSNFKELVKGKYLKVEEIESILENLARMYPSILRLIPMLEEPVINYTNR